MIKLSILLLLSLIGSCRCFIQLSGNDLSTTFTARKIHPRQSRYHLTTPAMQRKDSSSPLLEAESSTATRNSFLSKAATAAFVLVSSFTSFSSSSSAAPENVKGTKKDPAYEACLSKYIYDCTKPKGEFTKDRSECRQEAKKACATTKQQLMLGTPIAAPSD